MLSVTGDQIAGGFVMRNNLKSIPIHLFESMDNRTRLPFIMHNKRSDPSHPMRHRTPVYLYLQGGILLKKEWSPTMPSRQVELITTCGGEEQHN